MCEPNPQNGIHGITNFLIPGFRNQSRNCNSCYPLTQMFCVQARERASAQTLIQNTNTQYIMYIVYTSIQVHTHTC